ncbi:MAG: MlaE family lipid ABC transporter permease subunit [Planctomycetota bacterium]|nr:MAG: MlaE family lipid ABC transporter permease subunit [Planctomycetota bacterium]
MGRAASRFHLPIDFLFWKPSIELPKLCGPPFLGNQDPLAATAFDLQAHGGGKLLEVELAGRLELKDCQTLSRALRATLHPLPERCRVNMAKVERLDGAAAAVLMEVSVELCAQGRPLEFISAPPDVQAILDIYYTDCAQASLRAAPVRQGIFDQIGRSTVELWRQAKEGLDFLGEMLLALVAAVRKPSSVQWRGTGTLMEKAGADGLPIVVLLGFLVGLTLAYQSSNQLKLYGANLMVADLVTISLARELGPLLTAIIVTGRSGAAFAAEIGTMKVSEEIDALYTLGICPYRYLVFPRVLALGFILPLLTILADVVGSAGGLVIGVTELDLTPAAYLAETRTALTLWDVTSGLVKSLVFGIVIALVCCHKGLAARGGAEGVGRTTTSAVVTSLFLLIVLDTALTILFHNMRL